MNIFKQEFSGTFLAQGFTPCLSIVRHAFLSKNRKLNIISKTAIKFVIICWNVAHAFFAHSAWKLRQDLQEVPLHHIHPKS